MSNHFDDDLYATEEHIMEAMRAFFTRSNDYQSEFEKQIGDFELTSCIIDNLFSQIEIIMQHRDLYFIAKDAVKRLDKIEKEKHKLQ